MSNPLPVGRIPILYIYIYICIFYQFSRVVVSRRSKNRKIPYGSSSTVEASVPNLGLMGILQNGKDVISQNGGGGGDFRVHLGEARPPENNNNF